MDSSLCPANREHGEMVEIFDTGLFYCYDCKLGQWLRNARRVLAAAKERDSQ